MEFKSIENKKETGVWKIIRNEFVQIFDLRNIEHFVHNVKHHKMTIITILKYSLLEIWLFKMKNLLNKRDTVKTD